MTDGTDGPRAASVTDGDTAAVRKYFSLLVTGGIILERRLYATGCSSFIIIF